MRKRIGEFLVEKKVLTPREVEEIITHASRTGLKFGGAALELGLLTPQKLAKVLGPNFHITFFHLDPKYFPEETQGALPVDLILSAGALPLGFKTKHKFFKSVKSLNVGFLNPSRKDAVEKVAQHFDGEITPYLVLTDQFLDVMSKVYKVTAGDIRAKAAADESSVDDTLLMFMEDLA